MWRHSNTERYSKTATSDTLHESVMESSGGGGPSRSTSPVALSDIRTWCTNRRLRNGNKESEEYKARSSEGSDRRGHWSVWCRFPACEHFVMHQTELAIHPISRCAKRRWALDSIFESRRTPGASAASGQARSVQPTRIPERIFRSALRQTSAPRHTQEERPGRAAYAGARSRARIQNEMVVLSTL